MCFAVFRVKVGFERALLVLEYGNQCSYIKLYVVVILCKFHPDRVMLNGFKRHVYNATIAKWMNRIIAHCIILSNTVRENGFKRHVYNATIAKWMNRIIAHCIVLSNNEKMFFLTLTFFAHIPCNIFGIDDKCLSKSNVF